MKKQTKKVDKAAVEKLESEIANLEAKLEQLRSKKPEPEPKEEKHDRKKKVVTKVAEMKNKSAAKKAWKNDKERTAFLAKARDAYFKKMGYGKYAKKKKKA